MINEVSCVTLTSCIVPLFYTDISCTLVILNRKNVLIRECTNLIDFVLRLAKSTNAIDILMLIPDKWN